MALMASAATTATPLTIHHHQREAPASTSVIASSSFSSDSSPPPWPSLQADWPTVLFNCVICGCWGAEVRSVPPKAAETAAQDALKRWRRAVTGSRNRSSSAPSSLRHYMYDPPANWVEWAAQARSVPLFVSTGKLFAGTGGGSGSGSQGDAVVATLRGGDDRLSRDLTLASGRNVASSRNPLLGDRVIGPLLRATLSCVGFHRCSKIYGGGPKDWTGGMSLGDF